MNAFKINSTLSVILIALATSVSAFASPTGGSNSPANAAEIIGAQMDVTEAGINQLMQNLYVRKPSPQFNIEDYRSIEPGFQSKINQGLELFEYQLQYSVMRKLKFWMDRYNSIYTSSAFSTVQKKLILAHQLKLFSDELKTIDEEYQTDILRVYGLAGDLPYDVQLTIYYSGDDCRGMDSSGNSNYFDTLPHTIRNQFDLKHPWRGCIDYEIYQPVRFLSGIDKQINRSEILTTNDVDTAGPVRIIKYSTERGCDRCMRLYAGNWVSRAKWITNQDVFAQILTMKFPTTVYPIIAKGCRSQLCVGLRAGDISLFLNLVHQDVDRDIPITLMDGTKLKVLGPDLDIAIANKFLDDTNYPVSLPFDTK